MLTVLTDTCRDRISYVKSMPLGMPQSLKMLVGSSLFQTALALHEGTDVWPSLKASYVKIPFLSSYQLSEEKSEEVFQKKSCWQQLE